MWFAIAVALAARVLVPAGPWREVSRAGDIVVEVRPIKDSDFEEMRATTTVPMSAQKAIALMWGRGKSPSVSTSEVLEETPAERLLYETVSAPFISTRDYVVRYSRDDAKGEVRFLSIDDPRRPPTKERVRIPHISGHTVFIPEGPDRCRVVHTVYAETGGNVPAWVARAGQRDSMTDVLKYLRTRAGATR